MALPGIVNSRTQTSSQTQTRGTSHCRHFWLITHMNCLHLTLRSMICSTVLRVISTLVHCSHTSPKRAPTSNEPHLQNGNIAPDGPGSDPFGESTGIHGKAVEDLDCGLLTGSELLFSPLPPYVLNNEVYEVVEVKEESNKCRNSS